jgi:uncharacterized membrane protein
MNFITHLEHMKLKFAILLLIVFSNISTAYSQQDTSKSSADTIQYAKRNERYFFNSKKLSTTKLESMFNRFNSSAIELKEYKKRVTVGTIVLLTGITAGVIALTRIKKDTHFYTPYTITLFVGDLIGIPFMISANKHLKKSVRLYNQEMLR